MYCTSCGANLVESAKYCEHCGNAVGSGSGTGSAVMAPAQSRLPGHLRLLGILWIAESALRLVPGLILLFIVFAGSAILTALFGPVIPAILVIGMPILAVVGAFLFIGAILGLATGWGLLERKPWARTWALILGIVGLPHVPFGTALGIYTLWVLLPAEAEREYSEASSLAGGAPFMAPN